MKVTFVHRSGREQTMQRRYADVLQKLGRGTYMTRDMRAHPVIQPGASSAVTNVTKEAPDELSALRAEYQEIVGKRPYHGWDADQLREKIAEARDE